MTRAADRLVETIRAHGLDRIFCVPGESYLSLLDALHGSEIELVVCRHEGGAGFMAVADARLTGRAGLAAVSRGPGATNASIAVHLANQDAVPLVLLVGQVARFERGRGAFQEVDYQQMFGWYLRALHFWGSNFMVALVTIHMIQVFLFGAYKYPRELSWVVGSGLFLCVILMAFTVVIVGGIAFGVVTPTESAAVATLMALVVRSPSVLMSLTTPWFLRMTPLSWTPVLIAPTSSSTQRLRALQDSP